MSSRHLIKPLSAGGFLPAPAGGTGSRTVRGLAGALAGVTAVLLVACATSPTSDYPSDRGESGASAPTADPKGVGAPPAPAAASQTAPGTGSGAAAPGGAPAEIPRRAVADFERAVGMMRSGNATEAELEFKQISVTYPQLSAPYVNLGILFRKGGRLDQSETVLKTAVERNASNAIAWTELGATQRLRGEFQDAASSYEKAIGADPNYAPAYRNLGVVSDLYLADPERALTAFERYRALTGEEKPVSGWIAELRQRTGKPAVKPAPAPSPAPESADPAQAPAPATAPGAPPAPSKPAPGDAPGGPAPKAGG